MGAPRGARGRPGWSDYLQSLEVFGMRPGLERVRALLAKLREPQRAFRSIHVVGTNGKSSTTRYAEAILRAHGLRSAAYLSPHITGFAERLVVGGAPVSDAAFGAAVDAVRQAGVGLPEALGPVTQFEALTVAAFLAMREEGVEAAAVEAGLGGRLDATNVLGAPVVVLTNVGLEHTEVLGDTREAIFAEKAAVITRGAEAVFGPLDGLEGAAEEACARAHASARLLGREIVVSGDPASFTVTVDGVVYDRLSVPTPAIYQTTNAALAVAAADLLLGRLDAGRVRDALAATGVPGRLQRVADRPLTLADGAHNPDGVRALVAALAGLDPPSPRVAVLAVMRDKAVGEMLRLLLPLVDAVVCTRASESRSLGAGELLDLVVRAGLPREKARAEADPAAAVEVARRLSGPGGSVLVTGSLYLLADLAGLIVGPRGEV